MDAVNSTPAASTNHLNSNIRYINHFQGLDFGHCVHNCVPLFIGVCHKLPFKRTAIVPAQIGNIATESLVDHGRVDPINIRLKS